MIVVCIGGGGILVICMLGWFVSVISGGGIEGWGWRGWGGWGEWWWVRRWMYGWVCYDCFC